METKPTRIPQEKPSMIPPMTEITNRQGNPAMESKSIVPDEVIPLKPSRAEMLIEPENFGFSTDSEMVNFFQNTASNNALSVETKPSRQTNTGTFLGLAAIGIALFIILK